jgi:hypothetical protein
MARYRCACGAWGIRQGAGSMFRRAGGPIVALKQTPVTDEAPAVTARPAELGETTHGQVIDGRGVPLATTGRRTRRARGAA